MPQQNDFIPVNWRIAITDNLDTEHIMMCNVVAETDDAVVVENGRKTYTMIFCKKTGRHLNPLPGLLDCLVLGGVSPVLCPEHPRGRVFERGLLDDCV